MGHSRQLNTKEKQEDFRVLRSSLKNSEIILYNELLERLKNQKNKVFGKRASFVRHKEVSWRKPCRIAFSVSHACGCYEIGYHLLVILLFVNYYFSEQGVVYIYNVVPHFMKPQLLTFLLLSLTACGQNEENRKIYQTALF